MFVGVEFATPTNKRAKRPRLTLESTVDVGKTMSEASSERTADFFSSPSLPPTFRRLQKQKRVDPVVMPTTDKECEIVHTEPAHRPFPEVIPSFLISYLCTFTAFLFWVVIFFIH